jgi:hypothetical protein
MKIVQDCGFLIVPFVAPYTAAGNPLLNPSWFTESENVIPNYFAEYPVQLATGDSG